MLYKKTLASKHKLIILWNKDLLFDYIWINKFVNQCIWEGKKDKVENYYYKSLALLKSVTSFLVLYLFEALFLIKPLILLRWLRLGKKWHQIARPIHEELQYRMGFFLLSKMFKLKNRKLSKKPHVRLFDELISLVHDKRSKLLDFKNDMYNIALFNRSLFRFKW